MSKKNDDLGDFLSGFGVSLGCFTIIAFIGFFLAVAASR